MAKHSNEDLFEGTKMTFGEHLEELRVVLVRGLMGLVVGVLIGMMLTGQKFSIIMTGTGVVALAGIENVPGLSSRQ